MSDDADLDVIRQLATRLREALEVYWASGIPIMSTGLRMPSQPCDRCGRALHRFRRAL